MTPRLRSYLDARRALVERALRRLDVPRLGPAALLGRSMRHSLLAGGKRLRPILVLAAAEACGGRTEDALPAACAAELIHTYSLIHDDLPAMDDDDLRRGRPTNHKVFGEGVAILAGDALLTLAFEVAAGSARGGSARPADALEAVRVLSSSAGPRGMVAGQLADLLAEKEGAAACARASGLKRLAFIHRNKTAALMTGCLDAGAALARASAAQRSALRAYGRALGMAFQITDDVLDVVGDPKTLGKNGSDRANGKLTYPAVVGVEGARRAARSWAGKARRALRPLGGKAWPLRELADAVVERDR